MPVVGGSVEYFVRVVVEVVAAAIAVALAAVEVQEKFVAEVVPVVWVVGQVVVALVLGLAAEHSHCGNEEKISKN